MIICTCSAQLKGIGKMNRTIMVGLFCLTLLSTYAWSGTADPSGVSGAFLGAIVLAPLVVLTLGGTAIGGIRGAIAGIVIYAIGLGLFWKSAQDAEIKLLAAHQEDIENWSTKCRNEGGETGNQLRISSNAVFVRIDAKLLSQFSISKNDASSAIHIVSSIPERLNPGEISADIHSVARPTSESDSRHYSGIEVEVRDSEGNLSAKRVNFRDGNKSCLWDGASEDVGIERFIRRILAVDRPVLFTSVMPSALTPTNYPIAKLSAVEDGIFVPNSSVRIGTPEKIVPNEWGCKFISDASTNHKLIYCPNREGTLEHDQILERASSIQNVENGWLVFLLPDPTLTGEDYRVYFDRALLQERDLRGQPIRQWAIRFPGVFSGRGVALGEATFFEDQAHFYMLTKNCKEITLTSERNYCARVGITFPTK